jgi:cytochrome c peroxidase
MARLGSFHFPMRKKTRFWMGVVAALVLASSPKVGVAQSQQGVAQRNSDIQNLQPYLNATGFVATYSETGKIDTRGEFFQSLGTNGRSCATCHQAAQAMSISARGVRDRFIQTKGRDPVFAAIDGANCPNARPGDALARSLLLRSGLIRVFLATPTTGSQFTVSAAYDPFGCAVDMSTGSQVLSFYRRPLPTTNLQFLSAIMFDGRESLSFPLNSSATFGGNLRIDLATQALHAVQTHAQSTKDPSPAQLAAIVNMEMGLYTAQVYDFSAGLLNGYSAHGGPQILSKQTYAPGINDSLTPPIFSPIIFTLFSGWSGQAGSKAADARAQIAAGEVLFNSFPINITNVRGVNDNPALGSPAVLTGTCGTCHDTPNVGNHSLPLPLDIGTGHSPKYETNPQIQSALAQLSFPDLPVYEVSGCTEPFTGATTIYTTDLGKAMLTGQCGDLGRVKGPILRGLAARAPYFHNGAASNLNELVNFYNQRFNMGLSDQQRAQLVAFLNSL